MSVEDERTELINRVKSYIQRHEFRNLSLSELASEANYSVFHFQRIFKSVVGETPKQYINRVRLENAAHCISLSPTISILEVGFEYGFDSLESFSRAFKNYYKISPISFRGSSKEKQIAILRRKTGDFLDANLFIRNNKQLEEIEVKIIKLPQIKAFYIPVTLSDPNTVTNGYKKITQWKEDGQVNERNYEVFSLLLDYPLYTTLRRCRLHICISGDINFDNNRGLNYIEIPSRTYVSFKVKGGITSLIQEITTLNNTWVPNGNYKFIHSPAILKPLDNPLSTHQHDITYQVFAAVTSK